MEKPADEPVVDERNPEMESIEVPELHFDDTPVQNQTMQRRTEVFRHIVKNGVEAESFTVLYFNIIP